MNALYNYKMKTCKQIISPTQSPKNNCGYIFMNTCCAIFQLQIGYADGDDLRLKFHCAEEALKVSVNDQEVFSYTGIHVNGLPPTVGVRRISIVSRAREFAPPPCHWLFGCSSVECSAGITAASWEFGIYFLLFVSIVPPASIIAVNVNNL